MHASFRILWKLRARAWLVTLLVVRLLTDHESVVVCVPATFHVQPTTRLKSRLQSRQINTRCDLSVCSTRTWILMKLDAIVRFQQIASYASRRWLEVELWTIVTRYMRSLYAACKGQWSIGAWLIFHVFKHFLCYRIYWDHWFCD